VRAADAAAAPASTSKAPGGFPPLLWGCLSCVAAASAAERGQDSGGPAARGRAGPAGGAARGRTGRGPPAAGRRRTPRARPWPCRWRSGTPWRPARRWAAGGVDKSLHAASAGASWFLGAHAAGWCWPARPTLQVAPPLSSTTHGPSSIRHWLHQPARDVERCWDDSGCPPALFDLLATTSINVSGQAPALVAHTCPCALGHRQPLQHRRSAQGMYLRSPATEFPPGSGTLVPRSLKPPKPRQAVDEGDAYTARSSRVRLLLCAPVWRAHARPALCLSAAQRRVRAAASRQPAIGLGPCRPCAPRRCPHFEKMGQGYSCFGPGPQPPADEKSALPAPARSHQARPGHVSAKHSADAGQVNALGWLLLLSVGRGLHKCTRVRHMNALAHPSHARLRCPRSGCGRLLCRRAARAARPPPRTPACPRRPARRPRRPPPRQRRHRTAAGCQRTRRMMPRRPCSRWTTCGRCPTRRAAAPRRGCAPAAHLL